MIDDYSFGEIVINGTRYDSDVIIFPDGRVLHPWWRAEGHRLTYQDIADLATDQPELIIAGTGEYGLMKPEPTLKAELGKQGINFEALPTPQAIKLYNDLLESSRIGACLHLTC